MPPPDVAIYHYNKMDFHTRKFVANTWVKPIGTK